LSVRRIQTPEAFAELYQPARYKVFWGGRGGAKSTAFADALLAQADEQPLRILCAREIQDSIRESVHQLIADRAKAGRYPFEVKNSEIVHPNGSRFFFAGLWRNIDSIKSIEGVDIVWVEEASRVSEESWRKLIPTIRKSGSEIWASFNPELKSDPAYQRFVITPPPNAIVRKVSWRDNPWLTQELRDELEHLKAVDYDQYLHVWEGELKKYADGAVYAKQLRQAREEGRICRLPIQPAEEVNVFYDLGKSDATSAWFHQRIGPDDRFIDYMEWTGADIDEIAKAVKASGYNLGRHYMPHDVEHDILGFGNRTRKQMFEAAGIKPITVVPRIRHLHEGIEMTRQRFASYWFDEQRCERGLECLSSYAYERSDALNDLRPEPAHNWASHAADALRQHAQGFRKGKGFDEPVARQRVPITATRSTTWIV